MEQAKFEGYAVVEIMGHQRIAGYVRSVAFGNVTMFHVTLPTGEPQEVTLETGMWVNGESLAPGSRIRTTPEQVDRLLGAAAIFAINPTTEDDCRRLQPVKVEILERAERAALVPADADIVDGDFDEDDEDF